MSRVITYSRFFPSYHPKAGQRTCFVEKILSGKKAYYGLLLELNPHVEDETIIFNFWHSLSDFKQDPKGHTIRAGHRFKPGDWFSPRVWSGKPYHSKQIIIAPDIQVKKVWGFRIQGGKAFVGDWKELADSGLEQIAKNDGLSFFDFVHWFHEFSRPFDGQIIAWDDKIEYT